MKLKDLGLSALDYYYLEQMKKEKVINAEYIFTMKRKYDKIMTEGLERMNNLGKPVEEE